MKNRLKVFHNFRAAFVAAATFGMTLVSATAMQTTAAISAPAERPGHVYLMRGLLNIFSLGMDDLAQKIRRQGVSASVSNHAGWSSLADEMIAKYRAGDRSPIILMGHSFGADATISVARKLNAAKVPVALIVNFDPTSPEQVPPNVKQVVNYYVPAGWGRAVEAGSKFRGNIANVNESARVGHFGIDKSDDLHRKTIAKVLQVTAPRRPVRKPAPTPDASASAPTATITR